MCESTGGSGGSTLDFQEEGFGVRFLSPVPMEIFLSTSNEALVVRNPP